MSFRQVGRRYISYNWADLAENGQNKCPEWRQNDPRPSVGGQNEFRQVGPRYISYKFRSVAENGQNEPRFWV